MAIDSEIRVHQEWLGYLQPVGLVVSPPALSAAQAFPNKHIIPDHARFLNLVDTVKLPGQDDPVAAISDLPRFCADMLGWSQDEVAGTDEGGPLPDSLEVTLPEYNETLRPTYAIREPVPDEKGEQPWMMLIQEVAAGLDLDAAPDTGDHRWQASPQARFERLLRETQVPIGLLSNRTSLRLVYAPRGETSGHLTFPVQAMTEVAGRPIIAAFLMLFSHKRLFLLSDKQRLPAILSDSRKYQNLVSTQLAEQVLAALYELVRGFQSADDQRRGDLLREVLADDPNHVYAGLLTVLMRLVFVLYAEDRGLLSNDEVYQKYYAVTGLFERLREDAGRHTDTMDHRYGAWAQLLALFRLIHDGGRHGRMKLLARKGYLFDPDRYPFLEGRAKGSKRQPGERTDPPHVSDGVVFRVLHNLLILGGERLSYRTLDVEQIGSVYETMMGFNLEVAQGRSIAIKPKKAHGAPSTINLDELLAQKPSERAKWLKQKTDQEVTGQGATALKEAKTPEDAVAALEKKVAKAATPRIVPPGAMVLQPSDERRKSGSHYTPRSLTEPIVRTTLQPILERLGKSPKPEEILDLKLCDPAMGSGAFLVEACRELGDELVKAWHAHDCVPAIPPDEDELLHARRIIAQRCLYGVDKNPMAVDLAKLSLWLATLAKEHPFTFLDHALRCGDSLVGLTKAQILGFHWKPDKQRDFARAAIEGQLTRAMEQRKQIREAPDGTSDALLREKLQAADGFLEQSRRYGDLVISAFFAEDNERKRKERLEALAEDLVAQRSRYDVARHARLEAAVNDLRSGAHAVASFHWEIEFPEVFDRENPGFDAIVGNPPFLGGPTIGGRLGLVYHEILVEMFPPATGLVDLVAFFLRRSFGLLRKNASFGLIAKNTILQGDTRVTGLEAIVREDGHIYAATRRYRWPGEAAVNVCVVWIAKKLRVSKVLLDDKAVDRISAFLLKGSADLMPTELVTNKNICFQGTKVWGAGFIFEERPSGGSSSLVDLDRILSIDMSNEDVIFPYIGGEEFNSSPLLKPSRFAIDFGDRSEAEARQWPALFSIVEERVRPVRATNKQRNYRENWWLHTNRVEEAGPYSKVHGRLLALSSASKHLALAFVASGTIVANTMNVFLLHDDASFAILQSRVHENWVRLVGSSLEDRIRYITPCFETFPRPSASEVNALTTIGREYCEHRSGTMIRNDEGLTETYNRFHDPDERSPDIFKLRELHAAMDRAVLDTYGWHDLAESATCEFLLDYEEDEEDDEESNGGRRRKKPWRYRWPDDFRDEVLARLLELNRQRAEEERLSGAAAEKSGKKAKGKTTRGKKKSTNDGQLTMFPQSSSKTSGSEEGTS